MKNSKLYSLILIFAVALLSIQCTTDPIPGPPGEDGIDGIDGIDGVDGTAECAVCHNVAKSEEVHASYMFSGHFNENMDHDDLPLSQYANRSFGGTSACAACHTNDGYIDWAETGSTLFGGTPLYSGTQTISCTACHGKHTSFDFETDGKDYALRIIDPVTLIADNSVTLDYGDDFTSHTCATCHQPRSTFEGSINEDGTVNVSGRFGPHYSAQSTLLEGIQGAELDGYEYRRADGTAIHRVGSSCVNCHMGESTGNNDGLHTTKWTETSCTQCHQNGVPTTVTGYEEAYKNLEDLLLAEGLLEIDDDGEISIVPNPNADLIPAAALWNYRMLYYDHSKGVHNPLYATDLLQNSIDALNGN
jgi:hypothetical protein